MFVPWVYSFSLVQLNHPRDSLLFHIKGHWMEQGKMKERCDKIIEHISVFCLLQILSQFGSYFLVFLPISWDFIRNGSYVSILKVNEISQYQICVLYEWLITNINKLPDIMLESYQNVKYQALIDKFWFFSFLHRHHWQHLQLLCASWKPSESYIYKIIFESIDCSFTFRSHVLGCWIVSLWVPCCLYLLQGKHLSKSITICVSILKIKLLIQMLFWIRTGVK